MFPIPKKYRSGTNYTVYFYDDAPRIGSGYRKVIAVVGRKWVYVFSEYANASCRLRLADWNKKLRSKR